MSMYELEKKFLKRVEDPNKKEMNTREIYDEEKIGQLVLTYKDIPEEYINYLKEIGSGSFREGQFMVYGWIDKIENIVGEELYSLEEEVLFFGDNFSGDLSGFLINDGWKIVELWQLSDELYKTGMTFKEYIREQMLIGEDGEDLRAKQENYSQ